MDKHQAQLLEFAKAFGCQQHMGEVPAFYDDVPHQTRWTLIEEEYTELKRAWETSNIAHIASEMADLLYIIYFAANGLGIDLEEVFDAVHTANMQKLGEDGNPILREDGKILKPPGWTPANIARIIDEQGFRIRARRNTL